MDTGKFPFPRCFRIRKRPEILQIQQSGKKVYSRHFLIILRPAVLPVSRAAFTVTRKVDKRAVKRNRLKRIMREVFRLHQHKLMQPFDLLFIARQNATELNYFEVKREILGCLRHKRYLQD